MSERKELKRALADFPIKTPFPLKRTPVELKPPAPVAVTTQVIPLNQVSSETVVTQATVVAATTQVVLESQASAQATVSEATRVAKETQVVTKTEVNVATQVPAETKIPITGGAQANTAGRQDSSVVLESQAAPKLHNGYTRLPNSILMRIVSGDLLRSEIQIVLLIARFTISFQRRYAPLSKSVLERQTGLRGPAILQAIAALIGKGLVEKIPGDQYRPNQLGLKFEDDWDFFDKPGVTKDTTVPPQTQVTSGTSAAMQATAPVAMPTPAGVSAGTTYKDNKTIKNKNSLSSLPKVLKDYFSELKPERKRESEWKSFETLLSDYNAEDISDCFTEIQVRGVPVVRDGVELAERCHSPMAYLGMAMTEVLTQVQKNREKARVQAEREQRAAEEQKHRLENEARETAEWIKKENAFLRAFPSDDCQREVLAELCRSLPFRPHTEAGRTVAITKWWESLSLYERIELVD